MSTLDVWLYRRKPKKVRAHHQRPPITRPLDLIQPIRTGFNYRRALSEGSRRERNIQFLSLLEEGRYTLKGTQKVIEKRVAQWKRRLAEHKKQVEKGTWKPPNSMFAVAMPGYYTGRFEKNIEELEREKESVKHFFKLVRDPKEKLWLEATVETQWKGGKKAVHAAIEHIRRRQR